MFQRLPTFFDRSRAQRGAIAMALLLAATAIVAASPSASQAGTHPGGAVHGEFNEYASGPSLGYDHISGHAKLVRTGDGRTTAKVKIKGLNPETIYGVHVHAGPCADLGPHYFFDTAVPDGDGPAGDEIWPGPVITNKKGHAHGKTAVGATAGPTAASVVVHAPTGERIACADLS